MNPKALLVASVSSLAACTSDPAPPAPSLGEVTLTAATTPAPATAQPVASASASAPAREIVGAKQVLIAFKGASGAPDTVTRTHEQAKARADEALAKLRGGTSSFDELVRVYSDDPMAPRTGGAIGNFERNAMPRAYSDAAFALEVGAVSDVIETPRGFFLIQRVR